MFKGSDKGRAKFHPGGTEVRFVVESKPGDQGTPGRAGLCCALCTVLLASVVHSSLNTGSDYVLTVEKLAAIVEEASRVYFKRRRPTHLLDVEEALEACKGELETPVIISTVVPGVIPPASERLACKADDILVPMLVTGAQPGDLAPFSLETLSYIISAAVREGGVNIYSVLISRHCVTLLIDARKGEGQLTAQILDTFGSILPFSVGFTPAFDGKVVIFSFSEDQLTATEGLPKVSRNVQSALNKVFKKASAWSPAVQQLGPKEYVPLQEQLYHFFLGLASNSRSAAESKLDDMHGLSQLYDLPRIYFTRLEPAPYAGYEGYGNLLVDFSSASRTAINSRRFSHSINDEESVTICTPAGVSRRISRRSSMDSVSCSSGPTSARQSWGGSSSNSSGTTFARRSSGGSSSGTASACQSCGDNSSSSNSSLGISLPTITTSSSCSSLEESATGLAPTTPLAIPPSLVKLEEITVVEEEEDSEAATIGDPTQGVSAAAAAAVPVIIVAGKRSLFDRAMHKVAKRCRAAWRKVASALLSCVAAPSVHG